MVKVKRWAEPPPKKSQGGRPKNGTTEPRKHRSLISELRTRPGKWALLSYGERSPTSVFSELATIEGVEVTSRTDPSWGTRIYARALSHSTTHPDSTNDEAVA